MQFTFDRVFVQGELLAGWLGMVIVCVVRKNKRGELLEEEGL